jgi:hypothetical protein
MRVVCAALFLALFGCQSAHSGELSHEECADLVRHVQRLQSDDTGGMRLALTVGLQGGIEGCMAKGTQRAYVCIQHAESVKDLESCNMLMKE